MIDAETDAGQLVITICNYDKYQNGNDEPAQEVAQEVAQKRRRSGANKNNLKNLKKDNKKEYSHFTDIAFSEYNVLADKIGLPQALKLTTDRRKKLSARLDEFGLDGWRQALSNLEASDFCRGQNDRRWKASLDFLLQPGSFTRVLEGVYVQQQGIDWSKTYD
jgi:hypothetical protein